MLNRIFIIAILVSIALFFVLIWHNRAHPKVIETLIAFLGGAIVLFVLILQPEKHEIKFPFVYFYDWDKGKQVDLTTPRNDFIEAIILRSGSCDDILKARLKEESFLVTRDIIEYIVLKWLGMTRFGYEEYPPTSRITHLGVTTFGGPKFTKPRLKFKTIPVAQLNNLTKSNIFSEIIQNHPFSTVHFEEVNIPQNAKLEIIKHDDNKVAIKIHERLWFDLIIDITIYSGGIVTNNKWAKQFLDLGKDGVNRLDSFKIYETIGQMEIKWELNRFSIGNPDIGAYRLWLSAITDRLQNYFDWDKKCNLMHLEASSDTDKYKVSQKK